MRDEATAAVTDGWAIPDSNRVAHYFVGAQSLCRFWQYAGKTCSTPAPVAIQCRTCAEKATK